MRRILLVTIQNNLNFGNRLQNYALQTVLEEAGYTVDNLSLQGIKLADMSISASFYFMMIVKRIAALFFAKYLRSASAMSRRYKCASFSKKHIHNYLILSRDILKKYDFSEYLSAVTGSDQVWHNWNRIPDELDYYYLGYINKERRIAYAPSFGFDRFPDDDIELHKNGLLGMKALSCREKDGCNLIYQLIGKNAECVLDPTILLSSKDWEKIEKKPARFPKTKYLLQFMLGDTTNEYEKEIRRLSNQFDAKIININDKNHPKYFGISPAEFIWLIHHADVVCTDSFHATVFSIVFSKNARVFKRVSKGFENMFGRFDSLLLPLNLGNIIYDQTQEAPTSTCLSHDAVMYLEKEKKKSIDFLLNNISSV